VSAPTTSPADVAIASEVVCIDGNEAAARAAYALSETVAIYPITPASPMGEFADEWAARGRTNAWGVVPSVSQLQSEAGAAGALHGADPGRFARRDLHRLAGAAPDGPRDVQDRRGADPDGHPRGGAHGRDARAVDLRRPLRRDGGPADGLDHAVLVLPQEAHDLAAISHAATLESRLPVLHFMDGFRTSHELNSVRLLDDTDLRGLVDEDALLAHRGRGLDPDRPVLRGSAQNPDVFFQAREAINPYYDAAPGIVQAVMDRFAAVSGRAYSLVEYHGAPDATRVLVVMGSAIGPIRETIELLDAQGDAGGPVGVVHLRLYRPFPTDALLDVLPASVERILVLDRTKEPGAVGEPLLEDVVTALAEAVMHGRLGRLPKVHGARYGLASKEFTPAMVAGLLDELAAPSPRPRMTVASSTT
jgi:pyruvate-ferredoxin/flavodoxin oxidoreductase